MESRIEKIPVQNASVELFIKREDLIHPFISGNKFRKLKYNLLEAKAQNHKTLLTFGGAFSNHIAATAFAGKEYNFKTIGIIRGDELATKISENPTLKFAQENGMQLEFVTREDYKIKDSKRFREYLSVKHGSFYFIPEGGTNALAVKGCSEIITENDGVYDYVVLSVGTGGTIAGVINGSFPHQKVLGFPALKGDFLEQEICNFTDRKNWELQLNYHFGGYGKISNELILFINAFYEKTKIPLDPIYTGKLVFGVMDMIKNDYFPKNSKILIIHTGGLQGITGMNLKLKNKKLPTINSHD